MRNQQIMTCNAIVGRELKQFYWQPQNNHQVQEMNLWMNFTENWRDNLKSGQWHVQGAPLHHNYSREEHPLIRAQQDVGSEGYDGSDTVTDIAVCHSFSILHCCIPSDGDCNRGRYQLLPAYTTPLSPDFSPVLLLLQPKLN